MSTNVITLLVEVNYHRKVKLDIHTITKDRINKLHNKITYIFSKHTTDIGITGLLQMMLIPKTENHTHIP